MSKNIIMSNDNNNPNTKIYVVVINGMGGSGKSTFVNLCKNTRPDLTSPVKVFELSTVDYVKEVAQYCGWTGSKLAKDRLFLSNLKKALEQWDDIPVKKLFQEMFDLIDSGVNQNSNVVFFVNSREPKDIQRIKIHCQQNDYNFFTLKILNPRIEVNEVPELRSGIDHYEYNYIINNDSSIEDLQRKADDFLITLTENQ